MTTRFLPGFGAAVLLAAGLILAAGPSVSGRGLDSPQAQPSATQAPTPADYVGDDTCTTCHTNQTLKGTKHGIASDPRTPAAQHGCESCHGPGSAHAEAGGDKNEPGFATIRNFKKLTAAEASAVCSTCR